MEKILNSKPIKIYFTITIFVICVAYFFVYSLLLSRSLSSSIDFGNGLIYFLYLFFFGLRTTSPDPNGINYNWILKFMHNEMLLVLSILLLTIVILELLKVIKNNGIIKPIISLSLGINYIINSVIYNEGVPLKIISILIYILSMIILFPYALYSFMLFALRIKEDLDYRERVFKKLSTYLLVCLIVTIAFYAVVICYRLIHPALIMFQDPDTRVRQPYEIFLDFFYTNKPSVSVIANMSLIVIWIVLLTICFRKIKPVENTDSNN